MSTPSAPTRALVLGGGGVVGIGWEIGVLTGLAAAGVDLRGADLVLGTSAGAFTGVLLLSGQDLETAFAAQDEPAVGEIAAGFTGELMAAYGEAYQLGGGDQRALGRALGAVARRFPEPVPRALRMEVVAARVGTDRWPSPRLHITAINAETGELHEFTEASGIALLDALAATGAVSGVWPLEHWDGRDWIDGGMTSPANARLAAGYDRVLVIAPSPQGIAGLPDVRADVATLSEQAQVLLIAPDEGSLAAFGDNMLDPSRRGPAAKAGRVQAEAVAAEVLDLWRV